MSTRLYPITEDKMLLEKLANVAHGTYQKLDIIENQFYNQKIALNAELKTATEPRKQEIHMEIERIQRQKYTDTSNNELGQLNHFLNFGWGRLTQKAVNLLRNTNHSEAIGETENISFATKMINAQEIKLPDNITVAQLGGISWS